MDTGLSDHSSLEGHWADHPDRTVPALPVVVQLNVLEHLSPHRVPRLESLAMYGLDLEAVEEALGARIVVAIALCAHAALEFMPSQQRLVQRRAILAPAVGVDDHALGHLTAPQRHQEGVGGYIESERGLKHSKT